MHQSEKHHWLQPFVAYCTEMIQSILKFFHMPKKFFLDYHSMWVPNRDSIFQDFLPQPLVCQFFNILGHDDKLHQETKISVCFCANIAYMSIPFQFLRCHTKVFNIIHIFKDCSFWGVNGIDLFDPLPSKLHNFTFHGLKFHTPYPGSLPSWSISFWSFDVSSMLSVWWKQTQSSENRQISDSIPTLMSFIYKENISGPRTVPCDIRDKTGVHCNFAPLTTTFCCLLLRNDSIHTKVFPHAISMEFAFQKFMRRSVKGLLIPLWMYLLDCLHPKV